MNFKFNLIEKTCAMFLSAKAYSNSANHCPYKLQAIEEIHSVVFFLPKLIAIAIAVLID